MSYTTLYRLGADAEELGDINCAVMSGLYVWNDIAQRYFDLDTFPLFDLDKANIIWNAYEQVDMPDHEIIVLLSTMDKATINKKGLPSMIEAFKIYAREHPRSTIRLQLAILENVELDDNSVIAWQQTSTGEFWANIDCDEDGNAVYYDPRTGTDHFDIMKEMEEISKKG